MVRAPSPARPRYDDSDSDSFTSGSEDPRDSRSRGYKYEDSRTSDRNRDKDRGLAYGQYTPATSAKGHIPGAFDEDDDKKDRYYSKKEEVDLRYTDKRGKEKDYHAEFSYNKKDDRDDKKYGRYSPPERGARYSETDVYKRTERDSRDDYDRQLDRELEKARKEKEERERRDREREREREIERERAARRRDEEKHGRERGASFNLSAGHTSISGGVNFSHDHDKNSQYSRPAPNSSTYAEVKPWEYAKPDENITYSKRQETTYTTHRGAPYQYPTSSRHDSLSSYDSPRTSRSQIVTADPDARRRASSPNPAASLAPRMHSLSVSTGHHGSAALGVAAAPGSPLLEAYHGTYQSISPMPSPLLIANSSHSDLNIVEALSPLDEDDSRADRRSRRTARFHDPAEEAAILAKALRGERHAPDTQPLLEILPGLTHDQVMDLRVEYKKIVKTGSEKKGVNIAKHIKMRLKEEDPMLMKACYACALGQWESEAYWANFWYQGEKSRRELLIESLMGRTNREIRAIKDGFNDKKYSDSLTKCMKMELKEDKFKKAVLLVLEEKRMEEPRSGHGLDRELIEDDVRDLHKAVRSEKGGETAMINIIVVRSDSHLREVLRLYENTYKSNFAREMLKKSGNLVVSYAHLLTLIPFLPLLNFSSPFLYSIG